MNLADLAELRQRIADGRKKIAQARADGFDVTRWQARLLALQREYEDAMDQELGFGLPARRTPNCAPVSDCEVAAMEQERRAA